jgi:hypothetical protein
MRKRSGSKMEMSHSSLRKKEISLEFPENEAASLLLGLPMDEEPEVSESQYPPSFSSDTIVKKWEHHNIRCAIAQGPFRNCNGYVQIPKNHPWRTITDYNEVPVNVHGGLTFSDRDGWFGFDTGHYRDIWEGKNIMNNLMGLSFPRIPDDPIDWNMDSLTREVNSLATQVAEAGIGYV